VLKDEERDLLDGLTKPDMLKCVEVALSMAKLLDINHCTNLERDIILNQLERSHTAQICVTILKKHGY